MQHFHNLSIKEEYSLALKKLQKMGGIKETGELDDQTIKLMRSPR